MNKKSIQQSVIQGQRSFALFPGGWDWDTSHSAASITSPGGGISVPHTATPAVVSSEPATRGTTGATPNDVWDLMPGTNCQATFTGQGSVVTGTLSASFADPVLINGRAIPEKIKLHLIEDERKDSPEQALPQPGETWVCRILTKDPGNSLELTALHPIPGLALENVWLSSLNQSLIRVALEKKMNLMMIGEQGCGKTTIAEAIARKEGSRFRAIAGNTIKKYTYLLGQNIPTVLNGEQRLQFEESQFVKVLLEAQADSGNQCIALIDEYNRIDEKGQDLLLSVVAGARRVLHLPDGRVVPVPPNVRFFAACNEGSAFAVTASDAASKDRWMIVKIGYMPKAEELRHCLYLYPDCPSLPMEKAIDVINFLRAHRNDMTLRLNKSVSTRCAENTAAFLMEGISLKRALETAVANQYVGSIHDSRSECGRVAAVIKVQLSS